MLIASLRKTDRDGLSLRSVFVRVLAEVDADRVAPKQDGY